jgi:DNA-binding CsgD family transcriptional regulator
LLSSPLSLAPVRRRQAAHRYGLPHSTVKHHLANARSQVGAMTTAQLVWILAPRLPDP